MSKTMLKLNNTSTSRAKEKETGLGRQKLGNLSVIDMPLEPKNQGTIIRKDASQTDRMQGMRMRVQSKMIQNSLRLVFRQGIVSPFSRMRSKGSRFTLGVWGLRVCSLDVASASATVRNRPQPSARSPYGRAYGKFSRGGPFWRFQTCGCFVSRGRRGTSWHSDVFWNVSKVVLRGRRNTFVTFSEDVLQFSWQAQHFGRVHRHFSWQAQHFRRVVLRVFCKSHWQGCVKWRQGANSVAVVAFCAMCWKFTEASHETSILRLQIFRF